MRVLLILFFFITQSCFAQFNITSLSRVTLRDLQQSDQISDANEVAVILIDKQFSGLSGENIEEVYFTHKRLFRVKIFNSELFIKSGLNISDFEMTDVIKIVHFKQGVTEKTNGLVGLVKQSYTIQSLEKLDFNVMKVSDGDIVDFYLERKMGNVEKGDSRFWLLSNQYPTKTAFHEIEHPNVCKIRLDVNETSLNYNKGKVFERKFLNRYGDNARFAVSNLTAKVENVSSDKFKISNLVYEGIDYQSATKYDAPKFGSVSDEEMNMTIYDKDSSASAIVLYDYGEEKYVDFRSIFTRHIRIKILTKAGLSWGNWTFYTPDKGDIDVLVFNMENDIVNQEAVSASDIKRERVVNRYYTYKVFAPNVKVGSVIDVKYSHFGLPFEWRFQQLIPVKHSELKIVERNLKTSYFGFEPIKTIKIGHWSADNVPAFQREPFLNDYSNYITKFELHYAQKFNGFSFSNTSTWEELNKTFKNFWTFGTDRLVMKHLSDKAEELKNSNLSSINKLHLAYQYVTDNIKWNGINSMYTSMDTKKILFKNHSGNSADINLSLIALLNKSGIKTSPVVLSTRENGLLKPFHSDHNKLNYVVGYVKTDSLELLLDATSDELIPGILPEKCLNGPGWVLDEFEFRWIDLNSIYRKKTKQFVKIKMNEEGFFEGTINRSNSEYGYLNWIEQVKKFDNGNTYKAFLKEEYPDIEVLEYKKGKINKEKLSASEVITVDISNNVDDLGDEYIIDPFLLTKFKQNLFKSDSRKYPLDLKYPTEESATIVFDVPKDFKPISIPLPISLKGLDNALRFTFISQQNDSFVTMNYKIEIKKHIFTESEYQYVKNFFSAISDKFSETISLQKI